MARSTVFSAFAFVLSLTACQGSVMTLHDGSPAADAISEEIGGACFGCSNDDCDRDGISNADEDSLGTDRCNPDTDGDGINDGVEIGAMKICVESGDTPRPVETCSSDQDCVFGRCEGLDPTQADQDGDGVKDGEEDRNQDGLIGDCKGLCKSDEDCGPGQVCAPDRGVCSPLLSPECVGSETDPRLTDTDGDGTPDAQEGGHLVCKTDALITPTLSSDVDADWTIALDPAFGRARDVVVATAGATEVAIVSEDPRASVAIFALSKAGAADPLAQDQADEQLMTGTGLNIKAVFNRRPFTTYDGLSAASSQRLITSGGKSLDALRDELLTALIAKPPADINIPAAPSPVTGTGSGADDVLLLVSTVVRPDRVIILGALAKTADFNDGSKQTAIRMRDLINATGLAKARKGLAAECDDFVVEALPISDIVWLIDTSGSVSENDLPRIANAADAFFTKLEGSGIDFRLGVMRAGCNTSGVNLAGSRFTNDRQTFTRHVQRPNGPSGCQQEAPITAGKNLYELRLEPGPPVAPGAMTQGLRSGAKMIYVLVTDEEEKPLQDAIGDGDAGSRTRAQADFEALPGFVQLATYYQQKQITAFGMISLDPECRRDYEPAWAAKALVEKTGGASWPICKRDDAVLDQALNALVSAAQGLSSTFILSRVPISSTLKLAIEGKEIPRASQNGFDYDGPNNAIVFNIPVTSPLFPKLGDTIYVSYRFFEDAPTID